MFIVGNGSQSELVGVHPLLAACVWLAMTDSSRKYDSTLFDGLRTQREQDRHFAKGVSKVRFSRHQLGQAVDLVPYIDGRPRWDSTDPEMQKQIDDAFAENIKLMDKHAKKLGITLKRFDWDKPHHQLQNSNYDARKHMHRICLN